MPRIYAAHWQLDRTHGAFLCNDHDIRGLKDRISHEIIRNLDLAKIGIASSTYDIVGLPPIRVHGTAD